MPANQSLGVGRSRRLDTAIREIDVATGPLILTGSDNQSVTLEGGATKTYDPPLAGLLAYAPDGSRFHVIYETDPVDAEASRNRVGAKPKAKSRSRRKSTSRRASSTKAKAKSTRTSASKPKSTSKSKPAAKSKTKARSRGKKG